MGDNIYLFVPNLIGYLRIILVFVSCGLWFTHPYTVAICFIVSQFVLDDLDGIAARRLNQATLFGGIFDIVIDRCSFTIFVMGLCAIYPEYSILFQAFSYLDVMRIWMRSYGSALQPDHKAKDSGIVAFHYTVLGLYIFNYGSEFFFVMIYLLYFSIGPSVSLGDYQIGLWHVIAGALFPILVIKVFINLLILKEGCQDITAIDYAQRNKTS